MAAAIIDVYRALDQWAPFDTQMDFDNAGFLVGRGEAGGPEGPGVSGHHGGGGGGGRPLGGGADRLPPPGDFSSGEGPHRPDQHRADPAPAGGTGLRGGVRHINLDAAQGGVNDCLARALELDGVELLCRDGTDGQGRPYGIGPGWDGPSGRLFPPLNLPPLSRKSSPPAASVSWRRAGRCAG